MAEKLDEHFQRLGVASSEASVCLSSTDDFEFYCSFCKKSGGYIEAVGFCLECKEYLCVPCVCLHLNNSTLKGHVLLNLRSKITDVADVTDDKNRIQLQTTADNSSNFTKDIGNLTFLKSVNVKSGDDAGDYLIVAIAVLSKDLLAVADCKNKCVKIIDCSVDAIKGTLKLMNSPFSMTRLPQDRLAVTIAANACIAIVETQPTLKVIKIIRVDGACADIDYFDGKLLVSIFDPMLKLEVLDMNGKILEKIAPGPDVTSLCTAESFMAFRPEDSTILISDHKQKTCLSVDMKGQKIAECKRLTCPTGVVCPPGLPYIIVCDRDQHAVRALTLDLQFGEILLSRKNGLVGPYALGYCPDQGYLIVSSMINGCNNTMIMYQF